VCLLCNTPLGHESALLVPPWASRVHEVCSKPCGSALRGAAKGVCCSAPVLTVQKLFEVTMGIAIRCAQHGANPSAPVKAKVQAPPRPPRPSGQPPPPGTARKVPPRKPLRIEREPEKRSHNISAMFWPERHAAAAEAAEQGRLKQAKTGYDQGVRPPGAAYLYNSVSGFDYSVPKSLAESGDLAHEKDEGEADP
jgi:hypothetical protein